MLKATGRGCSDKPLLDFVHEEVMAGRTYGLRDMLLNREFARAVWGSQPVEWRVGGYRLAGLDGAVARVPAYEFHVVQAALADDVPGYYQHHRQEWDG